MGNPGCCPTSTVFERGPRHTVLRYAIVTYRVFAELYNACPGLKWDGSAVAADHGFDFASAIKEACRLEESYEDDLFFLTPLSSPDLTPNSTPSSSPLLLPKDLPTELGDELLRSAVLSPAIPTTCLPANLGAAELMDLDRPSKKRKQACSSNDDAGNLDAAHLSSSTSVGASTTPKLSCKDRKRAKARANRQEKRKREQAARFGGPAVREKARQKYAKLASLHFNDLDLGEAEATSTAYTARDDRVRIFETYTLEELIGKDSDWEFTLKKWDGKYVPLISCCIPTPKTNYCQNDDSSG